MEMNPAVSAGSLSLPNRWTRPLAQASCEGLIRARELADVPQPRAARLADHEETGQREEQETDGRRREGGLIPSPADKRPKEEQSDHAAEIPEGGAET